MPTFPNLSQKKKVSIAISPDTDDQFMILALRDGVIKSDEFEFEFVTADIQELNEQALEAHYDITAISIGAYPRLRHQYFLMPIGASIGDKFGPAVVTREGSDLTVDHLRGRRVAVPGLATSAAIAAQTLMGPFTAIPTYFMDIPEAVHSGAVDAGVLIHELQMNPETQHLKKIGDLGHLWHERFQLPLPLGANAIKRSLGPETILKLSRLYLSSIEHALLHRSESIHKAIQIAAARDHLDPTLGDRYIDKYVNHRSLAFQEDTIRGIEVMFGEGARLGLFEEFNIRTSIT
jgi:1,4-dihydroxy-6-naphthoate synthase